MPEVWISNRSIAKRVGGSLDAASREGTRVPSARSGRSAGNGRGKPGAGAHESEGLTGPRPRSYFVAPEGPVAARCFDMPSSRACTETIFGRAFIS